MFCVCGVCCKRVKRNQRKLSCTICKKYIHKCCSDMTSNGYRSKEITKYWHCRKCNDEIILPFNHIDGNTNFSSRTFEAKSTENNIGEKFDVSLDPTIFQADLDENNCNSYTEYF